MSDFFEFLAISRNLFTVINTISIQSQYEIHPFRNEIIGSSCISVTNLTRISRLAQCDLSRSGRHGAVLPITIEWTIDYTSSTSFLLKPDTVGPTVQ